MAGVAKSGEKQNGAESIQAITLQAIGDGGQFGSISAKLPNREREKKKQNKKW
jgi:hypothetical protein